MSLSAFFGAAAALLGVLFIWPQVIRVYAKQSVEGVSGHSQLIGLSGTQMWFTYGVSNESIPVILSNLNIEIAIIALVVMLVRKRTLPLWQPVVIFFVTAAFCAYFGVVAPTAVGITGVVIGTPAIFPQVWRAVRSERLMGVSVSSYVLLAMMGTAWFFYGQMMDDWVLSYPNLILIPSASFIAWKAWRSHEQAQLETTTP